MDAESHPQLAAGKQAHKFAFCRRVALDKSEGSVRGIVILGGGGWPTLNSRRELIHEGAPSKLCLGGGFYPPGSQRDRERSGQHPDAEFHL
jgi:hypothetical protein